MNKWYQTKYPAYWVNRNGEIKRVYKNGNERIIAQYLRRNAYFCKIHRLEVRASRLIYETFYGPTDKRIVHKNGLKWDNSINNLKAMSCKDIGKKYGYKSNNHMIEHWENGELVNTYRSIRSAARNLNYSHEAVRCIVKGITKNPILDLRMVEIERW